MNFGPNGRPLDSSGLPSRSSDGVLRRMDPAHRFALATALVAAGAAVALGLSGGFTLVAHPTTAYLVYAGLIIGGELFVLRLPSRTNDVLLSASSMFAFATALRYGAGPAMAPLCAAGVLKGLIDRRPVVKTLFTTAEHGITVAAAGMAYQQLGGHVGVVATRDLLPALGGGAAYLLVNYVLTGTLLALSTGSRMLRQFIRGLGIWLPVEGVMLAFAPVVPIVAHHSLFMIPLLLLPFLGVLYSARIARRAEHASLHDALTGLPNRVLFRMRVDQSLTRTRHTGSRVVVMVLDLDGFKEVNDTLGHGRGDDLLRAIAERLQRALREADVVARMGGDEFAVVLTVDAHQTVVPEVLAERIRETLEPPFQLGDLWVNAGASIGIACSPEHGLDAERLIQRADVAMYQAKTRATGHERYDGERDPNRPDNLRVLQELRVGIARDELTLHYQPKVRLTDGSVIGVEALARWKHPSRGLLMPVDFIELAERAEIVRSLTLSVAREATRQAAEWMAQGIRLPVAINLSPRILLDVGLPTDIATTLAEVGLPADMLEVEVTESCLIADPERTSEVLGRLSETGVRISIDDFGTGYSSMALLKRLPVNAIKIDRSFVGQLATDPNDMAIVESTIKLAAGLGLEAIAEGVETEDAWLLLDRFGCGQAQGFHICRPVPPAHLVAWLTDRVTAAV